MATCRICTHDEIAAGDTRVQFNEDEDHHDNVQND